MCFFRLDKLQADHEANKDECLWLFLFWQQYDVIIMSSITLFGVYMYRI